MNYTLDLPFDADPFGLHGPAGIRWDTWTLWQNSTLVLWRADNEDRQYSSDWQEYWLPGPSNEVPLLECS